MHAGVCAHVVRHSIEAALMALSAGPDIRPLMSASLLLSQALAEINTFIRDDDPAEPEGRDEPTDYTKPIDDYSLFPKPPHG